MSKLNLSLYLVLDPDLCGGPVGMVATALAAARNGATVVQLRAPDWKKRQWLDTALELKTALDPLGVPLIINDHVDVALAVDAAGVHVGQADLPAEVVRRLIGPDKVLGLSITALADLAHLPAAGVDYLGVGPVFPTGTKPDATPPMGVAVFAAIVAVTRLPVVAIGGIGAGNCAPLIAGGAQGVAVISAICGQTDPGEATRRVARAIDDGRVRVRSN
jgi:thiamine-phosphate pyrophosphorylase